MKQVSFPVPAIVIVAASAVLGQQRQNDISMSGLIGAWRLESRVVRQAGKVVSDTDLGELPIGYLMYDASGVMSVQLMKKHRSAAVECGGTLSSPANNTVTVNGFQAYFGTYM